MIEAKSKDVLREVSEDHVSKQEQKKNEPVKDDGEAKKAEEVKRKRDEATREEDVTGKRRRFVVRQDGHPLYSTGDAAPAEDPGSTTKDPKAGGESHKKSKAR